MEEYFSIIFDDIRHERSFILLLGLSEPSILKQCKFTDHEIEIIKNLALKKLTSSKNFKRISCYVIIRIKYIFS